MAVNDSLEAETLTTDDLLIVALAGGSTTKAAAELAGVSERTVFRRRAEPDFRRRLAVAREQMLDRAVGHLAAAASDAVVTLRNTLANNDSPALQVKAAEAILDRLGLTGRECPRCKGQRGDDQGNEASEVRRLEMVDIERRLDLLSVDQLKSLKEIAQVYKNGLASYPEQCGKTAQ